VGDSGKSGGAVLGLVERVKAIMVTPQAEWPAIAREPDHAQVIQFIAILAAIPALARFVGGWLIGGYTPFLPALAGAIVAYALSFAVVFALALIVDVLAPRFGAQRNYSNALRLTAYSFTPVWLAGIFLLVPGTSFLVLLGLYGFYLMWIGIPVLMQPSKDDTVPYVAAVAACAIALEVAARSAVIATIRALS
jgi:Yip1-like protein